jgi:hypothetical protein
MIALQLHQGIDGRVLVAGCATSPARPASAQRRFAALWIAAQALSVLAMTLPSHAQSVSPPAMNAPGSGAPTSTGYQVDARSLPCQELKARIRDAGSLIVTAGPGGGDLVHARAPQCEFWQRAQYTNARAKDGWCAVGYICAAKLPP